ncbi:MAG: hypothetical protein A2068_04105 [Ignavibacteria bacterium GWB2_35_6b]|nr:MAG: hypothetical protein A2068_04105 [Ignavibacteria bacterium GWB2_35_6b]
MEIKKYLITLLLLLFCIACENDQVVDISDFYKEKVVVRAELVKDSLFEGVSITRTLPLNSQYDFNKAEFESFTGYLRIDNTVIIPLHYSGDGIYKPLHNLIINGNKKYELIVNAGGTQIYAETYIPDTTVILKTYYKENTFLEARVLPNSKYSYGAVWALESVTNPEYSDDFFSLVEPLNNSGTITVQTKAFPEAYLTNQALRIQLFTFDKKFTEYFKTKKYSQSITNSYGQGGGPVTWNVQGENVIGIFIGYSRTGLIKPDRD